jgi:hypothetical protein
MKPHTPQSKDPKAAAKRYLDDFRYGTTNGTEIIDDLAGMARRARENQHVLTQEMYMGAIMLIDALLQEKYGTR